MAANFPGAGNVVPSVNVDVVTQTRGVSAPSGSRTMAIIGEGARSERLVNSAVGLGKDGFNPTYTSTTGSDGRHFKLSVFPIITNRTVLFKNGVPLVGLEEEFDSTSGAFSSSFDYRINIINGRIELQGAALVDQGGSFYTPSSLNIGNGTINSLTLEDVNAPTETWTVRCSSVKRDGYGVPIDGYARFIAQGSVSGILLDGYGNNVTWQSNGTLTSNGILSFSISEGSTAFREGDRFTIKVKSGVLSRGDSLLAEYIGETDLNDPEFFNDITKLTAKHGSPSLTNRLSLGAQIAFANVPPGVWACQAAPSIPRRVSYVLEESASGSVTIDDLSFALPLNVVPDFDSNINFFVTDAVSGTETQIIPNKVAFYDAGFTASPTTFTNGSDVFSYTVILQDARVKSGDDGIITSIGPSSATISSETVTFDSSDVGKTLKILLPDTNAGSYTVVSVSGGDATISGISFTDETNVEFEVLDSSEQSALILFTSDLALAAGERLRATVVDTKDANFFDVGWAAAYRALEKIDCNIVVPLPSQTISSIFAGGRAHCESMSTNKRAKWRMLFIGAIRGLTSEQVIGTEPAAVEDLGILEGIQGDNVDEILAGNIEDLTDYGVPTNYGNTFRVVFCYPDEIVVQIGADRTAVDGFFLAPALGAFFSKNPNVADPATNKTMTGFTILRNKLFDPETLERLTASGITVFQPVLGGGTAIWGKTTISNLVPEEEEISIVFIRDAISYGLKATFKFIIGQPESETTQGTLMSVAEKAFQGFKSRKWITNYKDIRVARDSVEPRQWNITALAQPTYPVNWVYVQVGIGLIV